MPTDDEIRRVAEDVRALARSLTRDIREAVAQARNDPRAEGRATRDELRQMRSQFHSRRRHPRGPQYWAPWWQDPGAPAGSPRWDNWGRRPGARPGQGDPAEGPPLPATAPLPPRHRRDSSALLGLLAVVFGLAWLAAGSHLLRVSGEAVLAVALMVLGAATVITARTDWALSRRKWPIWLGAGLVIVLIGTWTSPGFGRDF
ncbi:MAG TPA: DUF308 domain-containing protein, partial [Acidimicrobiales bacterium]|nr:DUF308 domain-containing protein [Acidimicrobiales bacterium]